MTIFTSKGDQLTVKMDPVIRLDNGIEIWFGKYYENLWDQKMIFATCGHKLKDIEGLGVTCTVKHFSRDGSRALSFVTYCFDCYKQAIINDEVLLTEEAEEEWMNEDQDR